MGVADEASGPREEWFEAEVPFKVPPQLPSQSRTRPAGRLPADTEARRAAVCFGLYHERRGKVFPGNHQACPGVDLGYTFTPSLSSASKYRVDITGALGKHKY